MVPTPVFLTRRATCLAGLHGCEAHDPDIPVHAPPPMRGLRGSHHGGQEQVPPLQRPHRERLPHLTEAGRPGERGAGLDAKRGEYRRFKD